jgi:hypothetical protein
VRSCVTGRFRVLICRRNRPGQSDSENEIRPVRLSVCDHWTHRKVTVDAQKSDGGRREKWREKWRSSGVQVRPTGPGRGLPGFEKGKQETETGFPFSVFYFSCVCPTQRFRVLICWQNRFWILGLGFFFRGSKGGNKGPRERERSSASSGCLRSDVRRCLQCALITYMSSFIALSSEILMKFSEFFF